MHISLPNDIKHFIETQIAQEGYNSASDYLGALVRDAQKKKARQELEAKLVEGLHGPSVAMTREEWDSIAQEALAGLPGEPPHS